MKVIKNGFNFKREYNIYCDESGNVENTPGYFVIGSIFIPRDQKNKIVNDLKKIISKYGFNRELKWNKVTGRFIDLYKVLIDYFIDNSDIEFKCIVVNRKNIDYRFHDDNKELAFYKFYYQLLSHKFKNDAQYYIFTDEKSRSFEPRFKELKKCLFKNNQKNNLNVNIKHMQEYDSKENLLLQLTDFLTGVVFFTNNYKLNKSAKTTVSKYLSDKLSQKLDVGTNSLFEKFNIFKWVPKKKYGCD